MTIENKLTNYMKDEALKSGPPPSIDEIREVAGGALQLQRSPAAATRSRRVLLPIGVAAAVLAGMVGIYTLGGSPDDRGNRSTASTASETSSGTPEFAVLDGTGRPVDGHVSDEPEARTPAGVIVWSTAKSTTNAVAYFTSAQAGIASVDSLSASYSTTTIGSAEVQVAEPSSDSNGLRLAKWQAGDGFHNLAARGLDSGQFDLLLGKLVEGTPVEDAAPAGYTSAYAGPDLNPFAGADGSSNLLAYEVGNGQVATINFYASAAPLEAYGWFPTTTSVDEGGGRTIWTVTYGEQSQAVWSEAGGTVVVGAPTGEISSVVTQARLVDRQEWESALDDVSDPGSVFREGEAQTSTTGN